MRQNIPPEIPKPRGV